MNKRARNRSTPAVPPSASTRSTKWTQAIPYVALAVSTITAGSQVYFQLQDRELKQRMAYPLMEITMFTNQQSVAILAENGGLGPARVAWVEARVDRYPKRTWETVWQALGVPHASDYEFAYLAPGIVSQEAGTTLLNISRSNPLAEEIVKASNRLDIRICYCSLYDECWLTTSNKRGETVKSCFPRPEGLFGEPDEIPER